MFSQRGIERFAAALLIISVVAVVVSVVTYAEPIDLGNPGTAEIHDTLREINDDGDLFLTSTAFFIFASLISIPMAAGLYLAFRDHDRALALLGSFGFLTVGVINSSLAMTRFAIHHLAEDFVIGTAAQQAIVVMDARVLGSMIDFMAPTGAMGIALGVFAYGLLVVRTSVLPRWMGAAGMFSGIVLLISWIEFADDAIDGVLLIGLLIGLVFAMFAGFYMLLHELRQPPAQARTAETAAD